MWKDKIIVWEDSSHYWNEFGTNTELKNIDEDLYAKGIVIWKKISLGDFIERVISIFDASNDYIEDKNILTGVVLAISAISLFPFNVKVIKDDEIANKFLSLIHRDKAEHYILKSELENSDFGKIESVKLLIENFVKNNVLIDSDNKYIINGKILNKSHILSEE